MRRRETPRQKRSLAEMRVDQASDRLPFVGHTHRVKLHAKPIGNPPGRFLKPCGVHAGRRRRPCSDGAHLHQPSDVFTSARCRFFISHMFTICSAGGLRIVLCAVPVLPQVKADHVLVHGEHEAVVARPAIENAPGRCTRTRKETAGGMADDARVFQSTRATLEISAK